LGAPDSVPSATMVWAPATFGPETLTSTNNAASHGLCGQTVPREVNLAAARHGATTNRADLTGNVFMLPSPSGLRWNENACVSGAQTERRGEATGPVRDLRTGESSPAGLPEAMQVPT